MSKLQSYFKTYYLYKAWALSLLAMVGSLYFSEILHLPPCILCWYQRICMYPLVVILALGIILKDKKAVLYALPLSLIGLGISLYHNLLYYKILPEALAPCVNGISCTTKQLELFGFLTIPLMALIGFIFINTILILGLKFQKESQI